jgi:hypothetical protein
MALILNATARPAFCDAFGCVVPEQDLPDQDADGDPADRAPQPDWTEVLVAVRHVRQRQRVGERERRRVDEPVERAQRDEGPERRGLGEEPDERRANEVAEREHPLGGEAAVRQLPRDEGAEDRAGGAGGEHRADLAVRELAVPRDERVQDREPRAPDRVLQEHHDREAGSDVEGAGGSGRGLIHHGWGS